MTKVTLCGLVLLTAFASPSLAQSTAGDQGLAIDPSAYIQLDFRAFPNWDPTPGTGRLSRDSIEVRRLRAGLDGRWRKLRFEFSVDPLDDDGVFVKDAYAQLRLTPLVRVRAGQFKVPGTRDYGVSARSLDFLERSPLASTLGVGRDIGVRVDGDAKRLSYEVGVFAGDGVGRSDRSGPLVAGRVVVDLPADVELGASLSAASTAAADSASANGVVFRSASGYRFADAVYVQGRRTRLGADVEWTPGPWRFTAEVLRLDDQRLQQGLDYEDLPTAVGTGFSAVAVRQLRRRLDAAVRYDHLRFDDAGSATEADSVRPRATDIRARAEHSLTFGSSWLARSWLRVVGNVSVERYSDSRSAPTTGQADAFTASARLQVEWR
jgi:phosphate-selective porin